MNGLKTTNGSYWTSDSGEELSSILIFSPSRTTHIYWDRLRVPWAGANETDQSYTACIASNPSVNEHCCGEMGGALTSAANFNGTVSTTTYDVPLPQMSQTGVLGACYLVRTTQASTHNLPPELSSAMDVVSTRASLKIKTQEHDSIRSTSTLLCLSALCAMKSEVSRDLWRATGNQRMAPENPGRNQVPFATHYQ